MYYKFCYHFNDDANIKNKTNKYSNIIQKTPINHNHLIKEFSIM